MAEFNPIKETTDGVQAKKVIWTTKTIEMAIKGLEQGRKLVANPFYENNTKLLKGDLVFERTKKEIEEWKKCASDIHYFTEKYCKLMTPEGIKNIKLRDYQKNYLQHLVDNRLSIFLACRQCGKTTTSAIFLLHYILFNVDKNSLVLGNKRKTANEILDKIKKIYLEIPYFLKPGIYKWNESEIVLDNGCRCMSEATTINSGISFTFHCVLADEFAHIHPNILDSFYNNLFPTITAGKARFMITSTQNGYNLFYRLYTSSVKGENEYAPFKTDWWEVPEWNPDTKTWEKRDEKWHQLQVANYGSEDAFNRQFGTNFDISSNTLISRQILNKKQKQVVQFVNKELPGVTNSDAYFWDPLYEPMEMLRNDKFVITIDLATGIGVDYTTYIFNKLEKNEKDVVVTRCIGYYQDNWSSIDKNIISLIELCDKYCNMNNYLISYESNLYGELFKRLLFKYIDENSPSNFDESVLVKYYNERMTDFNYGVKMTTASKNKCCKFFKMEYEEDKIINDSTAFMNELSLFCDNKGNDTYQASFGHDDIVMAQLQLIMVQETLQYRELVSNIDMDLGENNSGYNFYDNFGDTYSININRLYGENYW